MPRMLSDGDDLLLWVPDGGIDNIHAPTVAELTATGVLDISLLVTKANFALGSTGDESISDPPLGAPGDSSIPGRTNYAGGMDFFRGTTPEDDEAWTTFTAKGIHGYLVHRVGKPRATAVAALDKVRVFGCYTGTPVPLVPDANGGYRKFHEDFFIQSEEVDERAVVATG